MEWLELDHGDIVEYGSHGVHMSEVAHLEEVDGFAVHFADVALAGSWDGIPPPCGSCSV